MDEDRFQELKDSLESEGRQELAAGILNTSEPYEVVEALEEMDEESRRKAFRCLTPEQGAAVLAELRGAYAQDVLSFVEPDELARFLSYLPADDAAGVLGNLTEDIREQVLGGMRRTERRAVGKILEHPEHSAGYVMTPEVWSMSGDHSVGEARQMLKTARPSDPLVAVFVFEPDTGVVSGQVPLLDLYRAQADIPLQRIARPVVPCYVDEDKEEVAQRFRKHDLLVMPVLNRDGTLAGRLTVDDVVDVIQEEAEGDFAYMAGAPDVEEPEYSVRQIARVRFPWLMLTMIAGLVNSLVIKNILELEAAVAIGAFVPVILAMGGSTGVQAAAVAVRAIALGYRRYTRLFNVIWREIRVGLGVGLTCGALTGAVVGIALGAAGFGSDEYGVAALGLTVGTAMCNAMIFGSLYGAVVPIVLHRFDVDPAVASGPFVTASNDFASALIYLGTCMVILP